MMQTTCSIFLKEFAESGILTTAYYSHLIPVFIAVLLGIFVLTHSKYSLLSKVFFGFTLTFSLWLLGDLVTWTSPVYDHIVTAWSFLDFLNIAFYLLAAYFFAVLVSGKNLNVKWQLAMLALALPAWWLTVTGHTITNFYQPACEAANNPWLTNYKLFVEMLVLAFIMLYGAFAFTRKTSSKRKILIVGIALVLFLVTFSSTEYIASVTGIYEMNLYSLFVLPIFLALIIFSITNLRIFAFRSFGTQLLIYILLIMVGSQFFFLESVTDKALTLITFILSVFLAIVLVKNINNEEKARNEIEKLARELQNANRKLTDLDKQKNEFLSFASHQIKNPLTALKGYSSMAIEGDYGPLSDELTTVFQTLFESTKSLIAVVQDFLDVTKIEAGGMKYDMKEFDLRAMVQDILAEMKPNAVAKKLELSDSLSEEAIIISGDETKLRQVFLNLIDNSIKYTPHGQIHVGLEKKNGRALFVVKDTGVGVEKKDIPKLFEKFARTADANKVNVTGTGLGLYLAREITNAHKGRIWIESEGEGRGSTFSVELPM